MLLKLFDVIEKLITPRLCICKLALPDHLILDGPKHAGLALFIEHRVDMLRFANKLFLVFSQQCCECLDLQIVVLGFGFEYELSR